MDGRDLSLELRHRFFELGCSGPLVVSVETDWTGKVDTTGLLGPGASTDRRAEFAMGRELAAQCLAAIGHEPMLIGRGPSREPLWPDGIRGSITHTRGLAAVVVWLPDDIQAGIGIDAERRGRIEQNDIDGALSARERDALAVLAPAERDQFSTAVFSAKEALYKAQYPLTGHFIDYADVTVLPDIRPTAAAAKPKLVLHDCASVLEPFECSIFYQCSGDFVVTGALVRARQPGLK